MDFQSAETGSIPVEGTIDLEKERARRRKYDLDRYYRRMQCGIEMLGGKCSKCPAMEGLEFDHIDPSTKLFTIRSNWGIGEALFLAELKKCQLLCKECHKKKTSHEQRVDVHGTWGMYRNRQCRCDVCRSFVAKYHAANKSKKRLRR